MSQQYTLAMNELYQALRLDAPIKVGEMMSLQVGEMVCHVTEHPDDSLLMFTNIGPIESFNLKQLLEHNMFNQELYKAVIGIDDASESGILWNRQSLLRAEPHSLYQQLEQLSKAHDNLSSPQETESQVSDHFYPAGFRV